MLGAIDYCAPVEADKMDVSGADKENMGLTGFHESDVRDVDMPGSSEADAEMEDHSAYTEQFLQLVNLLKALNLLYFFADNAVACIIRLKVHISGVCSDDVRLMSSGTRTHQGEMLYGV